ncbi:protein methyltransferase [Hyaloscypha hepaticicola]|uniref:Protein methyltransferase n=1 Tax=Hyaloscypha hepaticicola TaxID=2082293 RepID=A0A2J6QLR4_9HELO|nr:protein methyltransferase [Hyaloscypha hepaticicola]
MSKTKAAANVSKKVEIITLKRAEGLLLVIDTPKGRGVFAGRDIPGRTVLEVSPVLVLDPTENEEHIKKTDLYNYTYNWPYTSPTKTDQVSGTRTPPMQTQAVVLGLGSMFNHSTLQQNVGWERDVKNLLVTYTTLRDIKEGEELCISYGPRLTFKDVEEEPLDTSPEDWTEVLNIIDLID